MLRTGGFQSASLYDEQPSVIDDPTIKSGFYGAPCVCAVFAERDFLYSIPDAFCAAENMAISATALGISSCIVARGEETFDSDEGKRLLAEWGIPAGMVCRCLSKGNFCWRRIALHHRPQKNPSALQTDFFFFYFYPTSS